MNKGQRIHISFMGKSYYGNTVNQAKAALLDDLVGKERIKVECSCYEIQPGDTLYSIAKKLLGNGEAWPRIAKINRASIPNANEIFPGTVISLPKYVPIEEIVK